MNYQCCGDGTDIFRRASCARYASTTRQHDPPQMFITLPMSDIDNTWCRNRKLILCPSLFSRRHRATFPVHDDPVHCVKMSLSIKEYDAWLKKEFDSRQWHKIATWHYAPFPYHYYNLWKLKDIITPSEQVMASNLGEVLSAQA